MSYKTDEYYALERNLAKQKAIVQHIDNAMTFNKLAYCDEVCLTGRTRHDDQPVSITVRGDLLKKLVQFSAGHCVDAAEAVANGPWEQVQDYTRAAKV